MNNPIDCLEFLARPDEWPSKVCCLKRHRRHGQWPQFADLNRDMLGPPVLITEAMPTTTPTSEIETDLQTWSYDSLEALVADGWLVD